MCIRDRGTDPLRVLGERLAAYDTLAIDRIEAIDLTAYLRETSDIDVPPGERLRQLAIRTELEASCASMPRGYLALERIYEAARRLGCEDVDTSLAISAERCSSLNNDDLSARKGEQAARRAIAVRADDALAHYILGLLLYARDALEEARTCFETAIALDASMHWAKLYRAHCFHDEGRWVDAVSAYSSVNPAAFMGDTAWRYDLLREQRAFCRLMAGDRAQALTELDAIVERYEREPWLMDPLTLADLRCAATGALQPELGQRVERLLSRADVEPA